MPENVGLSTEKDASGFHVFDKRGDFLFSLTFPEVKANTCFIFIPLCLWAGAFMLIIFLYLNLLKYLVSKEQMVYRDYFSFFGIYTDLCNSSYYRETTVYFSD